MAQQAQQLSAASAQAQAQQAPQQPRLPANLAQAEWAFAPAPQPRQPSMTLAQALQASQAAHLSSAPQQPLQAAHPAAAPQQAQQPSKAAPQPHSEPCDQDVAAPEPQTAQPAGSAAAAAAPAAAGAVGQGAAQVAEADGAAAGQGLTPQEATRRFRELMDQSERRRTQISHQALLINDLRRQLARAQQQASRAQAELQQYRQAVTLHGRAEVEKLRQELGPAMERCASLQEAAARQRAADKVGNGAVRWTGI